MHAGEVHLVVGTPQEPLTWQPEGFQAKAQAHDDMSINSTCTDRMPMKCWDVFRPCLFSSSGRCGPGFTGFKELLQIEVLALGLPSSKHCPGPLRPAFHGIDRKSTVPFTRFGCSQKGTPPIVSVTKPRPRLSL